MTGDMPDQSEMTMNALYIRFFCAVLLLATALMATTVKAAGPAPVRANIVITYASQSLGSGGPLRCQH
ncbi:MAG TPA: hypothetical protein VFI49_14205 [Rudaea sp.]|nr:hypothetical protein [Rudaea sp.]